MTKEEITTIVQITNSADSGCFVCAGELAKDLAENFPEHEGTIAEIYMKCHEISITLNGNEYIWPES